MRFLTVEEVLYIHFQVIDRFGGLHGVRDSGGLESAVARPQTTVFGSDAYPTVIEKASSMLHSLILNHPFQDGNKRTAFAAVGLFLQLNGISITGVHREIEDFVVRVAEEHLSVVTIADWLLSHTKDGNFKN
ncbi:type II toxin-antitoxin system death-on-curing family toxin [Alicyclobacillus sp. ALC3]|uniref:type II toxin-antitoxin system death-on-curing family toxin n=1 Tax=Alicyclobacillus sp. ALC3 TaxID=2796143 RepID=UPI002377F10C|nr:type II toxin-antitoxin system death-on-curing family toxin [Alicyclobacillus sp. ALC3]WDL99744.1 type II toxin-antitoxin system death-on-curing family toxin [Alicyclobacillus sp. ALC3]